MKKIFFASLMVLVLGGVSYSQTTPAKTNAAPKKEAVKPASSVNAAAPVKNTKSNTVKAPAKPTTSAAASQAAIQPIKHKKVRHAAKKQK